jgi:hypothetical protein
MPIMDIRSSGLWGMPEGTEALGVSDTPRAPKRPRQTRAKFRFTYSHFMVPSEPTLTVGKGSTPQCSERGTAE